VKTTLRADDIGDWKQKVEAIQSLQPSRPHADESRYPVNALLAYDLGVTTAHLLTRLEDLPREYVDLICVVNAGLVGGRLIGNDGRLGFTFLRSDDEEDEVVEASVGVGEIYESREGRLYPVLDVDDRRLLVDPSRALLLFGEALIRGFANKQGRA